MGYLIAFAASAILACPLLLACAFLLAPAPIAAEYWVRQALVVKRDIARAQQGRRKAFVVGGSSALFGIDTARLSQEFGVPFVNMGMHARIPLTVQIEEVSGVAERGDAVVLTLEPDNYCAGALNDWYLRNALAWRPEAWREIPLRERAAAFWRAGPWILVELATARAARAILPWAIRDRLAALDDADTLRRHASSGEPSEFAYSIANLDRLGNMRGTEGGKRLRHEGTAADAHVPVCDGVRGVLRQYVERERTRGIEVRLAHPPFVAAPGTDPAKVSAAERRFAAELGDAARMLDKRADATFERALFFDSGLHLDAEGRRLRTDALVRAIRRDAALTDRLRAVDH